MINFAISGGDIPIPEKERGKTIATDATNANSLGKDAGDALEPPAREALDSEICNEGRPKRKENEKKIYVQLSDNYFDPEHAHHK